MSENTFRSDYRAIGEKLIRYLKKCEDGTAISTSQLLRVAGYAVDSFDEADLFEIHELLFELAGENHILLDMSAHEYRLEGLAYNLDFIVRHNAQE